MKELEYEKRPQKKVIPQITLLNPEKVGKTMNYNRKHTKADKDKEKGIKKRNIKSNPPK